MKNFHFKGNLPLTNGEGIALARALRVRVEPVIRQRRQLFTLVEGA